MLVLSRLKDESIVITTAQGRIEVMIVDVRGDKVRLGITAPKTISVHRAEVQQQIDADAERRQNEVESDHPNSVS